MNEVATEHGLDFEIAESPYKVLGYPVEHQMFRIGTCEGQWGSLADSYFIMSIKNSEPGNGHFKDVLQWFEHSAKRDNKNLLILQCVNRKFYTHLISKRGFNSLDKSRENCIKVFNRKLYLDLLNNGNELLKKGSLKCI